MSCPPEMVPPRRFGALAGIGDNVAGDGTFDLWRQYARLLRRRRRSEETIRLYDVVLHDLWSYLERVGVRWDHLTPEDIDAWLRRTCHVGKRDAGLPLQRGTLHTYGAIAKRSYRLFAERGWLRRNPLEDWEPPPRPAARPRALPVSAIGLLLTELAEDRRLTMIVALMYHQALRIGEVVKLSVEDITLITDPPMIHIDGKGGREDWMPLSPALVPALRAYLLTRPKAGPLIPNHRYPTQHLSARYGARLLAAAMRPVVGDSGHALRHTAAQQLRRLTRDPFIVKDALRHATLDMQASYVGADVELLADALGRLPDPLRKEAHP